MMLKKIYEKSAVYEGEFNVSSQYHGHGKLTYHDGSYYLGQWENGVRCGQGEEKLYDGSFYKGSFRDDKRHGPGTLTTPEKVEYEAVFEFGVMHGEAIRTFGKGKPIKTKFYHGFEVKVAD